MTTEELRSQLSQTIRSPSEMRDVVRVEALIAFIAVGITLLAMEASILGLFPGNSSSHPVAHPNSHSTTKPDATSSILPLTADNPKAIPPFEMILLFGGFGLILSVPVAAIIAWLQNRANKRLRKRADKAANLILDVWASPAKASLRVHLALVTKTEQVEIDEEKVSRILALLGTSAIDPSVWREARGSLRAIEVP